MQTRMVSKGVALVALIVCVGLSQEASAQDNFAEPSAEQMQLYESGFEAFKEGQWDKATERFEASLRIGEMNITYLNLGRSLHKAGHCLEARARYDKVSTAPQVRNPSPIQVLDKLDEYRRELDDCPGKLSVQCSAPAIVATVKKKGPVECGGSINLPPGDYEVVGTVGDKSVTKKVQVKAIDEVFVMLTIDGIGALGDEKDPPGGSGGGGGGLKVAGWVAVGLGVAALGAGGALFALNGGDSDRFDELNSQGLSCPADAECAELTELQTSLDSANVQIAAAIGVGAAAVVTGAVLLIIGYSGDDERATGSRLDLLWSPEQGVVGVQGRF